MDRGNELQGAGAVVVVLLVVLAPVVPTMAVGATATGGSAGVVPSQRSVEPGATVSGQLLFDNGTAAAEEFVYLRQDGDERLTYTVTDSDGEFSVDVAAGSNLDVYYTQANESVLLAPRDGIPDVYQFARVEDVGPETDLGTTTIPAGHVLDVRVENASGGPVEGANVSVYHEKADPGDADEPVYGTTNAAGLFEHEPGATPGLELAGNVTVEVHPPDTPAFVDEAYIRELAVTNDTTVTVRLAELGGGGGGGDTGEGSDRADLAVSVSATETQYRRLGVSASVTVTNVGGTDVLDPFDVVVTATDGTLTNRTIYTLGALNAGESNVTVVDLSDWARSNDVTGNVTLNASVAPVRNETDTDDNRADTTTTIAYRDLGDVSGDGTLDVADASAVARAVANGTATDPAADANDDGAVDSVDAMFIAQRANGVRDEDYELVGGPGAGPPTVEELGDEVVVTPRSPTTSLAVSVPASDRSSETGVRLDRLGVDFSTAQSSSITVAQRDGLVPSTPVMGGNRTAVAYFDVGHPSIPASSIAGATFRVRVNRSVLAGDPSGFGFVRYHDGRWETVNATLVDTTRTEYVFRVESPGLSIFAAIYEDFAEAEGPQQPDAIEAVSLVNTDDLDGDGVVSGFDVRVRANTSLRGFDGDEPGEAELRVLIDGTPVRSMHVRNTEDGTFLIPLAWGSWNLREVPPGSLDVQVQLVDDDTYDPSELGVDLAANESLTTSYEPIGDEVTRSEAFVAVVSRADGVYRAVGGTTLSAPWWDAAAERSASYIAETIESEIEGIIQPSASDSLLSLVGSIPLRSIQLLTRTVSRVQLLFKVTTNLFSAMELSERKAVEIHLDDPGYSSGSYADLHGKLRSLRSNGEALEAAIRDGNESRQRELLDARRRLLVETYGLLPRYLDDVHASVVADAAGAEDPAAYRIVRQQVLLLRGELQADYAATTSRLPGTYPDLATTTEMPTHGWRLVHRTAVFDTMDTPKDYTVYGVTVPEAEAGKPLRLRLDRQNDSLGETAEFDVLFTGSRVDSPNSVRGASFSAERFGVRRYTVENASAGTYFVVVRADGDVGSYSLAARVGGVDGLWLTGDSVPVTVVEREGPDIQRPQITLEEAPPTVELDSGRTVRATTTEETPVTLEWRVWDAKTDPSDIEYRLRRDSGSGFTPWSQWRGPSGQGVVSYAADLDAGVHRIQILVRDGVGRQSVQNVDVVVSGEVPQTYLAPDGLPDENRLFVRIIPDTRVRSVEFEYRENGTSEWTAWRNVTDTAGLGELTFDREGVYEIRARATGISGRVGPWGSTVVEYAPRDETPPGVSVVEHPDSPTNASSVRVAWRVDPRGSNRSNVEYRLTRDGRDSAWRPLPSDGLVALEFDPDPGTHTLTLTARDGANNTARHTVSFEVDRDPPSVTRFDASGDVERVYVDATVDEPDSYLQVANRSGSDAEWSRLGVATTRGDTVPLGAPGVHEVRVRPVDAAGNRGPWTDAERVRVLSANSTIVESTVNGTIGPGENETVDLSNSSLADGLASSARVALDGDLITGEAIVNLYVLTREGRELRIASIELAEDRNMTVAADLPPSLANATRLRVEIVNGSAYLRSLRLIDTSPTVPPVTVRPDPPVVGEPVTLSVDDRRGYLESVAWDLDGDGTFETTNRSVTTRFETSGPRNVGVRVVDVFGATNTTTTSVDVNAPPVANVSAPESVAQFEAAEFSAAGSADPDGSIVEYDWDFDGDGEYDAHGVTVSHAFRESGNRSVALRVTDDRGASDSATRTIRVRPSSINTSLSVSGDLDAPGNLVTVEYDLVNLEDARLENATIDIGELPDGWTIADASFDAWSQGSWNESRTAAEGVLQPSDPGSGRYEREDEMRLNIDLQVPDDASFGTYSVPATAQAEGVTLHERNAVVTIREPETTLSVGNDTDVPGNRVTLQYDLTNHEDARLENVNLDVGAIPDGWTIVGASFDAWSQGSWNESRTAAEGVLQPSDPGSGRYEREDEMRLNIDLQVPDDADLGEYRVPVTATAGNVTLHERTATATVRNVRTELSVGNDTDAPGNEVVLQYDLYNRGESRLENVRLDIGELPDGWTIVDASFDAWSQGSWNESATAAEGVLQPSDPGSGRYEREDEMRLNVRLQIPTNASFGAYSVPVTATVGNLTMHERSATIDVGEPETTLSVGNDTDVPGNRVTVEYDLVNREDTQIENVRLDIGDLPDGWTIVGASFDAWSQGSWNESATAAEGVLQPSDPGSGRYEREDEMRLDLELQVPANASFGEYRIPATATAGNVTLHERAATVAVRELRTELMVRGDTDAPGNEVVLQYDLHNRGDTRIENVRLDVGDLPDGWTLVGTSFDGYFDGSWNESRTAAEGELWESGSGSADDVRLDVRVQVPANASFGEYRVPVTATAGNVTLHERSATATVRKPETELSVGNDTDAPGNEVVLQYDLHNREDAQIENVRLDIGDLPDGWTLVDVSFDGYFDGSWNESRTAAEGELWESGSGSADDVRLDVRVQVPANASFGEYRVPVTATAGNVTLHERSATATVRKPETELSVGNDTDAPGNEVVLQYDLHNREDTQIENVRLDVGALPDGWTIVDTSFDGYFDGGWNETATAAEGVLWSARSGSADDVRLDVRVQVPANASFGEYRVPVTATAGNVTLHERSATATVERPDMSLSVGNDTDAPGNEVVLQYDLHNREDTRIENVRLDVGALPDGWTLVDVSFDGYFDGGWNETATAAEGVLRSAGSGSLDDIRLNVRVQVPANTSFGTYSVPVAATAGNVTLHERSATAEIREPETTLSVGNDTDAPGNEVVLQYDLYNREDTRIENVRLDVGALPDGWTIVETSFDGYFDGSWNESTTAAEGVLRSAGSGSLDDIRLNVRMQVPANASFGTYSVPVTATAGNLTLHERTATAEIGEPETELSVGNDTDAPGNEVVLQYDLYNREDTRIENVRLDVGALPNGWTLVDVSFDGYFDGGWNETATAAEGVLRPTGGGSLDDVRLNVRVQVPANASFGTYSVPVTATAGNLTLHERTATAEIGEPETTLSVGNDTDAPGNEVVLQYDLHNREDTQIENVRLDVGALPDGWTLVGTSFDGYFDGGWNESVTAAEGVLWSARSGSADDVRLDVRVQVPANASFGEYRVPVTATAGNVTLHERSAIAEIGEPETELSVGNDTGAPGTRVTVQYDLYNREDTRIENVRLDIGVLPDGWTIVETSFDGYFDGSWNESTTAAEGVLWSADRVDAADVRLDVQVQIPDSATLSEYSIPITATAGSVTLHERSATITVENSSTATATNSST